MCAGFATKKQVHFPEHHFGLLRY